MPTVKLSIGQVNITGYMLVVMRYSRTPSAEAQRMVIPPAEITNINNIVFDGVNPEPVMIDVRESPDGVALGNLLSTFQIDVNNKLNMFELRFYTVNGNADTDPPPGLTYIEDEYFEGKTIGSLFREGFRDLKEGIEYKREGNQLQLLNPDTGLQDGPVLIAGEVYVVTILYMQDQVLSVAPGANVSIKDITSSSPLDLSYLKCHCLYWSSTLTHSTTLPPIATVNNGDWIIFIDGGGNNRQFVVNADAPIYYNSRDNTRLVLGKGEWIKLVKHNTRWVYMEGSAALTQVGRFFKSYKQSELNALLTDFSLYNGNEYPRIWDYIKSLPLAHVLNSPNVPSGSYNPLPHFRGMWHMWESGADKYFRVPDKQNAFSRNLKHFNLSADSERSANVPGALQLQKVGKHFHTMFTPNNTGSDTLNPLTWLSYVFGNLRRGSNSDNYNLGGTETQPTVGRTSDGDGDSIGDENRPNNIGEFEFVHI